MNDIIKKENSEVFKEGIYDGIPNEAYHAALGVSRSDILKVKKSVMHYVDAKNNGGKKSASLSLGSFIHDLIMFPELIDNYAVEPQFDRRTTKGKTAYAEWVEENKGKTIIPKSACADGNVLEAAKAILKNIDSSEFLKKFLNKDYCKFEQSIFWIDEITGMLCKCRPDILSVSDDTAFYFEIKTCQDASYEAFRRDVKKWKYHVQASYYSEGIKKVLKVKKVIVCFFVIEVKSPYCIAVYDIDEDTIKKTIPVWRDGLEKMKDFQKTKKITGYDEKIKTISLNDYEI